MSGIVERLRKVSIRRRIAFTLVLYVLAVAVMVVAGWRVLVLSQSYRANSAALREQGREIAAMRRAIETMGTLGDVFLRTGDTALVARLNSMAGSVGETLARIEPDAESLDRVPRRLALSLSGYLESFEQVTTISMAMHELYVGYMASSEDLLEKRLVRMSELTADENGEIHELLLLGQADFAKTRSAIRAFLDSREGDGSVQAVAGLRMVRERLDLATSLDDGGMLRHDLRSAMTVLSALGTDVGKLKAMSDKRNRIARGFLTLYGRGMVRSVDSLTILMTERESALQDGLRAGMDRTMTVTGIGVVVLLVLGLALNSRIGASIRDPILALNAAMQDISEGNWDREIVSDGGADEIADMSRTLGGFKRNALRLRELEVEKREVLAREKAETERANAELDQANHEITLLNDRLNEENLRLGTELDVSRRLQQMLLPRDEELADIVPLDISAFMEPATEVGGDYYDVLSDGDGVRIGIGDVTGHGLESGVVMLMTQSAVRTLTTSREHDLPRLLEVLNSTLIRNIRRMGSEKNLTFSIVDYRPREALDAAGETVSGDLGGRITVTGQHESLLIVRRDGGIEELDTLMLGMPLGLVEPIGEYAGTARADLYPGDAVVLYSDGITEATDGEGRMFGIAGLKQVLAGQAGREAAAIKDAVIAAVRRHIGGTPLFDDMTLLVVRQK